MQALVNMNEQDVNVNGWPGSCCYSDGYLLCSLLFFDVFLSFFPERAVVLSMIVVFAVNTLPNAGSAFTVGA